MVGFKKERFRQALRFKDYDRAKEVLREMEPWMTISDYDDVARIIKEEAPWYDVEERGGEVRVDGITVDKWRGKIKIED